MSNLVVNGAPHAVDLYTKNSSGVPYVRELEANPQHLPKVYLFAEKGTEKEWLGGGNERKTQFGASTFMERSKYFTHTTELSNVVERLGNVCMYKRLLPDDAGPAANYTLWLDVLETNVDVYQRNADGSIKIVAGSPVLLSTVSGFVYKFVKTHNSNASSDQTFGLKTQMPGDQVDPLHPTVRSTRYPIWEQSASSRGYWGNNIGASFWSYDSRIETVPVKLVATERAFPYSVRVSKRDTKLNTLTPIPTVLDSLSVMFTLKPGSVDPSTDSEVYLPTTFEPNYNQTDSRYPIQEADLNGLYIYQNNIDTLLAKFHAAEIPFIDPMQYDFTAAPSDKYLFNILGGKTLSGYSYNTYIAAEDSISLNRHETIFADGGSDGTMSLEVLEQKVISEVRRYSDDYDEIQDKAYHIESHLYDTGFSLPTKLELGAFISIRGDTFVTFSTFQVGERSFDNSEELSIAQSIKAMLINLPESTNFGTGVVRAAIYGGDCELRGSNTKRRVSTVLEVAYKRAKYMGASNGRWKNKMQYDQGIGGSAAEITTNHSRLWVPVQVRYRFWDAGLNWWARFDRSQIFCPAFKTVFEDETSVLTADTVAMALIQLNKINDRSWRAHSGTVGKSDVLFISDVTRYNSDAVRDRFDGRFPIVPKVLITESDKARGSISWQSGFQLYADPMRTVAINYTEVFRNTTKSV